MTVSIENAPSKSVDDTDDRVEGIERTPFFRHDTGTETHRGYIKAQLEGEGDDIAKVSILDVQRRDPEAGT